MKIETLKQKGFKNMAIGIIASVYILSVAIFIGSYAKYRSTSSINIAKGTIKYKSPDLHLAEVYIANEAGEYELASVVPTIGYILNEDESKTRCENKDGSLADITITYEDGGLTFSKLVNGGVKCYVYLDKKPNAADKIPEGKVTDDSMFSGISGDGVYTWTKGDYSGGDQPIKYYRGNVNNNWVVFGRDGVNYIWWRIIRNNSNGSLRMIYAGTSASKTQVPTDTSQMMLSARAFNPSYDKNYYVGLKYSTDSMHGMTTNAPILGEITSTDKTTLYGWYNATLGTSVDYSEKIDLTAGFCSDRTHSKTQTLNSAADTVSGIGAGSTTTIYYGAYTRLHPNGSISGALPSLKCPGTNDKITDIPVGLITADEVNMAGIVTEVKSQIMWNTNSWIHIGNSYWTMSPYNFSSKNAYVFAVHFEGFLETYSVLIFTTAGIRPVVNLKADTVFVSGNGEASTPFVVQDT